MSKPTKPKGTRKSVPAKKVVRRRKKVTAAAPRAAKPFLKWAGNKHQIIGRLQGTFLELEKKHGPYKRIIEPFMGSGAVFMGTSFPEAVLADINPDLINLFQQVKKRGRKFIEEVEGLFVPSNNSETAFRALRSEFNSISLKAKAGKSRRAALFIYLNRHCFNGLCRYNSSGGFNVPFGKYRAPESPTSAMKAFSLKARNTQFLKQGFSKTMSDPSIGRGDLVYCDPPYVPLSSTSSFTAYAQEAFGPTEQQALAEAAERLRAAGATVVISNHDTRFSRQIYRNATRIKAFKVQRFISSKGADRKAAKELLAIFEPE